MSFHPPKPRLVLSVGVVGHRPNRLPEAARAKVETEIGTVLEQVRAATEVTKMRYSPVFTDEPPALRLISALAEGADRMAAEAALVKGFALSAILPFPAEVFEHDFTDEPSRGQFRKLLAKAEAVQSLPGKRTNALRAYEVAGRTLVDNADIMLAVWDGGDTGGSGGTTEILEHAANAGLPVIHIDATGQVSPRLLWRGFSAHDLGGGNLSQKPAADLAAFLPDVVDALVRPPTGDETAKLMTFLHQPLRSLNLRPELPVLLALLGLRMPRLSDVRPTPPDGLASGFARQAGVEPGAGFDAVASAYGWADAIAVRYAQVFRGAYILNFVLAALAVLMAAGSLVGTAIAGLPKWPFVLIELVFIGSIIANTAWGRRRDWHRRWIESREVAERLRAAVPLWLLGVRATNAPGPEPLWTGWYVRAHLRALGVCDGSLDSARRAEVTRILDDIIEAQCHYHGGNAVLMHKVEHRIERIGEILFAFTFMIAALYLLLAVGVPMPQWWSPLVTALTAGVPALAAATYGIRLIGDFVGSEQRSRRAEAALGRVREALRHGPEDLTYLRAAASAGAAAMLGDVEHWRLATETRELAIPG